MRELLNSSWRSRRQIKLRREFVNSGDSVNSEREFRGQVNSGDSIPIQDAGDSAQNPDTRHPSSRQIKLPHRQVSTHRHLVRRAAFDRAGRGRHRPLAVDRFGSAVKFARQSPFRRPVLACPGEAGDTGPRCLGA